MKLLCPPRPCAIPRIIRRVAGLGVFLSILAAFPPLSTSTAADWPAEAAGTRRDLPPPVNDPHSTEICLNSRVSYHGGWSGTAGDQPLADVLDAAAQAPVTGSTRTIYAATAQNVYLYDTDTRSLIIHKAGDWRSDATAAFEVGIAGSTFDAGAAMHLAQLESVALWTGTTGQLASCPRASATTYANGHWDLPDPVRIVISFGLRSVPGFTSTLRAASSDGSLPDPRMDGPVYLDTALHALACDSSFSSLGLTVSEVSQILWASYGCSDHVASGRAGLVCASAVANYYLTRHVYWLGPEGVYRYHCRRPPGTDATTRDHRIEMVASGDAGPALRAQIARLPEAPHYMVLCTATSGDWPELEVGFAGMGALLEASTLGLQGAFTTSFSAAEQSAIREATGIPSSDLPMAIVSLGHPSDITAAGSPPASGASLFLLIENPISAGGGVIIHYEIPLGAGAGLAIYDCLGHELRRLPVSHDTGRHTAVWDCRDDSGRPVASGAYFCRLKTGRSSKGELIIIFR